MKLRSIYSIFSVRAQLDLDYNDTEETRLFSTMLSSQNGCQPSVYESSIISLTFLWDMLVVLAMRTRIAKLGTDFRQQGRDSSEEIEDVGDHSAGFTTEF